MRSFLIRTVGGFVRTLAASNDNAVGGDEGGNMCGLTIQAVTTDGAALAKCVHVLPAPSLSAINACFQCTYKHTQLSLRMQFGVGGLPPGAAERFQMVLPPATAERGLGFLVSDVKYC